MAWQRPSGLGTQIPEGGVVLLDKLVQQRRFGSVPGIARWIDERRRTQSPRAGGNGHGGRPGDGRGRNRLCRDVSRRNMQIGSLRAEMPVREPAARGNRLPLLLVGDITRPPGEIEG